MTLSYSDSFITFPQSVLLLGNLGEKRHPSSNNIPLISPNWRIVFHSPWWWLTWCSQNLCGIFQFYFSLMNCWYMDDNWQINNMKYLYVWCLMPLMFNFLPVFSDNEGCCMVIQNKLFLDHIFHSWGSFSVWIFYSAPWLKRNPWTLFP